MIRTHVSLALLPTLLVACTADRPADGSAAAASATANDSGQLPQAASGAELLVGRIVESRTGRGVSGADVIITDSAGAPVGAAIADTSGEFSVLLPPGRYQVRARQVGFAAAGSELTSVRTGASARIDLSLEEQGLPLNALIVTTSEPENGVTGFAKRRRGGVGVFLTADSIAARSPALVMHAFRGIDGIELEEGAAAMHTFAVKSTRGPRCLALFVDDNPMPYAFSTAEARRAPRLAAAGGGDVNTMYRIDDLRAIELYYEWRQVPGELRRGGRLTDVAPCGVALIWTRAGW